MRTDCNRGSAEISEAKPVGGRAFFCQLDKFTFFFISLYLLTYIMFKVKLRKMKKIVFSLLILSFYNLLFAGNSQTADVATPGTLSSLVNNMSYVTELTVTGEINSNDINTINSKMTSLESLDLSGATISFNTLYKGAFKGNETIKKVILPETIKTIENNVFYECVALEEINIPDSLVEIGVRVFYGAEMLNKVSFPEKPKFNKTGLYMFEGCKRLTEVVLPVGIDTISFSTFLRCLSLEKIQLPEGLLFIGNSALRYTSSLKSIVLPSTLKRIDNNGFTGSAIESVDFPDSFESLGMGAFSECENITEIVFPEHLKEVNFNAFEKCSKLETVVFSSSVEKVLEGVFASCHSLKHFVVPSTVSYIGGSAFSGSKKLESIIILGDVEYLSRSLFYNCDSLKDVQMPASVTLLETNAFLDCEGLKSIALSPNLTQIEEQAFSKCTALTSIVLPAKVDTIGERVFYNCPFETLTSKNTVPPALGPDALSILDKSTCTLYVPAESVEIYKTADQWKDFGTILPIESVEPELELAPESLIYSETENSFSITSNTDWIIESPDSLISVSPAFGSGDAEVKVWVNGTIEDKTITLTITADNSLSANMDVVFKTTEEPTNIDDAEKKYCVFPNPATGSEITIQGIAGSEVQIFNLQGKLVSTSKTHSDIININNLPAGFYYILVNGESLAFYKK